MLAALAPGYWLFAAALVVIGVAALIFTNTTNSLMQLSTEPAMRGRVMALRLGVALGGTPIGAPIVGWTADHLGPRWALGIGATSGFAAALVAGYAMSKHVHRRTAPSPSRRGTRRPPLVRCLLSYRTRRVRLVGGGDHHEVDGRIDQHRL